MTFPKLTSQKKKHTLPRYSFSKVFWCLKSEPAVSIQVSYSSIQKKINLRKFSHLRTFDSFTDKITSLASETSVLKYKDLH